MAHLRVLLHGQLITELQLQSGQEYFAGRAAESQIKLMSERGISRQHLKFSEVNGRWQVKLLSKYGDITSQNQNSKELTLAGDMSFSIAPYEFHFNDGSANVAAANSSPVPIEAQAPESASSDTQASAKVSTNTMTEAIIQGATVPYDKEVALTLEGQSSVPKTDPTYQVNQAPLPFVTNQESDSEAPVDSQTKSGTKSISGRTMISPSPNLTPYLRIVNNKTKTEEVLKLEGNLWSVGRNPTCEIALNDTAISRKHFDISRTEKGFYVIDHGSSNGTRINGDKIIPADPHPLASSDVITVRHIEIILEIRDSNYDNRKLVAPMKFDDDSNFTSAADGGNGESGGNQLQLRGDSDQPVVLRVPRSSRNGSNSNGNASNKGIRVAIGLMVILLLYGLLSGPSKPKANQTDQSSKVSGDANIKPLTHDQEQQVSDIYNLAKSYYLQKKYVLCLSQFEKLNTLVPFYKDSKQVENYCQQGKELEQIDADRERKEREKQEVENRIKAVIDDCRAKAATLKTSADMSICLQSALELDPQNAAVNDLVMQMKVKEDQAQSEAQKAADFNHRKKEGQDLFDRAMKAQKAGDLKRALADYQRFLHGKYPGLNQKEDQATRNLASVKKGLSDQLNQALGGCQSALDKGDARAAVLSCDRVLRDNPNEAKARELRDRALSQLKREMKSIYEDSVLEESLGNIDAAKEKWSKIVDKSIPEDEYYKKAKSKLRKYGIGM